MSEDAFGFASARKKTSDKLAEIRPGGGKPDDAPLARIDAAGDAHGFRSREQAAAQPVLRRRRDIGPTVAINTRAPERVAEPFTRFCEENRYSYWEGIEELMKRAEIT